MKNFLTLILLFILSTANSQNLTKTDSVQPSLNVNVKTNSNTIKVVPADTLDSFLIKKTPKPAITIAKNYLQPKSDSYFDMAVYVVKKQFQDSPIISWILTAMLGFWIVRIIKRWIERG